MLSQSIKKILVIGPAWIGDMVMAHTLFQLLRQRYPMAIIDVLAPSWSEPLLNRMPEINHAVISPFAHGQLLLKQRYQFSKKLRLEKYDQAIVLPNSFKSALIPWFARIPIRTGWVGECRFGVLNDIRFLDKKIFSKMVQRFAVLAFSKKEKLPDNLPNPTFQISSSQIESALKKYYLAKPLQLLALCPGAEFGPSKRWPPEYFAEIANAKISQGWSVWLFGSKNDAAIAEIIQAKTKNRCVNLIGKTSLSEAVDLLSLATIVVTNDSGLMHIAAALNRPIIAIYGSTSTEFTPPLSSQAKIIQLNLPCQPCFQKKCPLKHHHCMRQLLPHQVLSALDNLYSVSQ